MSSRLIDECNAIVKAAFLPVVDGIYPESRHFSTFRINTVKSAHYAPGAERPSPVSCPCPLPILGPTSALPPRPMLPTRSPQSWGCPDWPPSRPDGSIGTLFRGMFRAKGLSCSTTISVGSQKCDCWSSALQKTRNCKRGSPEQQKLSRYHSAPKTSLSGLIFLPSKQRRLPLTSKHRAIYRRFPSGAAS